MPYLRGKNATVWAPTGKNRERRLKVRGKWLCTILLLLPAPVCAQTSFEVWSASEFQLTLSPETDPALAWHDIIPDRLRIYTEQQFAHDIGLRQALLRMGPIWNLLPGFSLGAHVTSSALPSSSRSFQQEVRFELEPTFKGLFQTQAD